MSDCVWHEAWGRWACIQIAPTVILRTSFFLFLTRAVERGPKSADGGAEWTTGPRRGQGMVQRVS